MFAKKKRETTTKPVDDLDTAIMALHRADGTLSRQDFKKLVLPVLHALHALAKEKEPSTADATIVELCAELSSALRKIGHTRMPQNRPGIDYRKYETTYSYVLFVAMAVEWYLLVAGESNAVEAVEQIVPLEGRDRLLEDPMVWKDWNEYFIGGNDGGLRELSGRKAVVPGKQQKAEPSKKGKDRPARRTFYVPDKNQQAGPIAAGWEVVGLIQAGVRDGALSVNGKGDCIQVDAEGRTFLKAPDVFEWCAKSLGEGTNPKTLENRFARLNIHVKLTNGGGKLRAGRPGQKRYLLGYVIEDSQFIWKDSAPPKGQFYVKNLTAGVPGDVVDEPNCQVIT